MFASVSPAAAQKVLEKVFDAHDLTSVNINADQMYRVELHTHRKPSVTIIASMEGEYRNDLVITADQKGSSLFVESRFMPLFKDPNDKLSAHKVVSVDLVISVPESVKVSLSGHATRVLPKGNFSDLEIKTYDGPVFLVGTSGLIEVRTFSGDIHASGIKGVIARAESSYGKIFKGKVVPGGSEFRFNSVNGNIHINENE
ncbi:hypothetical protein DMZ48_00800 [Robertkochia solimangrovi]|nr:hypothetical protein DMZ48_00800 [Robertkochia solimangrovi]